LPSREGKKEGRGASCRFVEALEERQSPILCIWRIEGGLGSLEHLGNTCWGDSGIIQALDTLGSTKWRINKRILDVVDRLWAGGGCLADLIDEEDVPIPEKPDTEDET